MNWWEFKKCGRELGGDKISELGECPASAEERLNGVHGGTNAGRACWIVAGTFCKGEIQGVFAKKYATCIDCDFYKKVQKENFNNFQITLTLSKESNDTRMTPTSMERNNPFLVCSFRRKFRI